MGTNHFLMQANHPHWSFHLTLLSILLPSLQASSGKLTEDERATQLSPLQEAGWTMVSDRDAIYKEFLFKDFIQVFFVN